MSEETKPQATLDPSLLELLVCPVSHGPLSYDAKANELISKEAGLAFPVRDGIPIMLPEEARKLSS
ncbi:MAG: Trm112 family protein [Rhodobiaceae bacterium]|nr:Trm112 family protein [Rhodobiaceae bacterium]MBT5517436.1 Trm112 family protein [Rhodobiaceae bacterium]MBT7280604.1 Trm112 family protein [Rhodobiaceae bacterium]MDG2495847.1 Trm112 family protein [Alphaproteobacteria bacterium]